MNPLPDDSKLKPFPGSNEAVEQGCDCPVADNGHGKGAYDDGDKYGFWVSGTCPLHQKHFPVPEDEWYRARAEGRPPWRPKLLCYLSQERR